MNGIKSFALGPHSAAVATQSVGAPQVSILSSGSLVIVNDRGSLENLRDAIDFALTEPAPPITALEVKAYRDGHGVSMGEALAACKKQRGAS